MSPSSPTYLATSVGATFQDHDEDGVRQPMPGATRFWPGACWPCTHKPNATIRTPIWFQESVVLAVIIKNKGV